MYSLYDRSSSPRHMDIHTYKTIINPKKLIFLKHIPYHKPLIITIMEYVVILLLCSIFHLYLLKKMQELVIWNPFNASTMIYLCIILPFVEECVFRSGLPTLLKDIPYNELLITTCYSLLHASNYWSMPYDCPIIYKRVIITSQCIMTFFLGLCLKELTLGYSILAHMLFNVTSSIITYYLQKVRNDIHIFLE